MSQYYPLIHSLTVVSVLISPIFGTNYYNCSQNDANSAINKLEELLAQGICSIVECQTDPNKTVSVPGPKHLIPLLLITNATNSNRFPVELLNFAETVIVNNSNFNGDSPKDSFYNFSEQSTHDHFAIKKFYYNYDADYKTVSHGSFKKFTNCSMIDLSHNELSDIGENPFPSSLEVLRLNNNKIRNIQISSFVSLKYLDYLDLSSNIIERIPYGSFSSQKSLSRLDISHNKLGSLPSRHWYYDFTITLLNLKVLIVNHNNHSSKHQIKIDHIKSFLQRLNSDPTAEYRLGLSGSINCKDLIKIARGREDLFKWDFTGTKKIRKTSNLFGVGCTVTK